MNKDIPSGWKPHLCEHERDGIEPIEREDEALPSHMIIHECPECGMFAEYDTDDGLYRSTV